MKRLQHITAFSLAVFLGTLIGCSSAIEMTSLWNDNAVTIDGSNTEWGPSLKPLSDPPVVLGIRNDGEFLYVCLSTQSPFLQAQILNGGLTVWLNPRGEKEETFGIRYPVHSENAPRWSPREPIAQTIQLLEPSFRELAILGPEEQQELFSLLQVRGIKVKLGVSENSLVYELRVPLRPSAEMPYAVGITENQIVGIGFQTPEFGSDRLQGPSGRASAGTRGGGRGGRGRSSTAADIAGTNRPEPVDFWLKVVLSPQR